MGSDLVVLVEWDCRVCGAAHGAEKEAAGCCLPAGLGVFVCPVCSERHSVEAEAAECLRSCLLRQERDVPLLKKFKFRPFVQEKEAPAAGSEVLLFLHDRWRGYDEIITAQFDGNSFYRDGYEVRARFVAGWLALPVQLAYGSSSELLV